MTFVLNNISKRFGPVIAIRHSSFSLEPGEVRALYGGNGSGKSTLAKIIAGILRPDTGAITMDGAELPLGNPRRVRRSGIAITFQELSLLPELTVAENLSFSHMPSRFGFRDDRKIHGQAEEILGRLSLSHLSTVPVEALHVGEKYLVEFAKLLLARPRIMVLDELTSALHDHEAAIVHGIIKEHSADGGSVVFVSHRVREILEICNTITVMRNGEAVADKAIDTVNADMLVEWAGGSGSSQDPDVHHPVAALADTPTLLHVNDIDCGAGPFSFSVKSGEIFGLGGLPDQGQTKITDTLIGDRHNPGISLSLRENQIRIASPADAIRHGIAYVTGDRDEIGFRSLSLALNIDAANINRPPPSGGSIEPKKALAVLKSMSTVHDGLDKPLDSLSGGNQQKVLLSRAFVSNPLILIAVDPTKGIDVAARAEVHRALRELVDETGACVIMTSSDDSELASVCDRILVMQDNAAKQELRVADGSLSRDALVNAYLHTD